VVSSVHISGSLCVIQISVILEHTHVISPWLFNQSNKTAAATGWYYWPWSSPPNINISLGILSVSLSMTSENPQVAKPI